MLVVAPEYLVEQGANNNNDNDAFSYACEYGYVNIVEYLLDVRHVDVDYTDYEGWTGLHCAAYHGHLDVAQVLFRYGAKLDARTNKVPHRAR